MVREQARFTGTLFLHPPPPRQARTAASRCPPNRPTPARRLRTQKATFTRKERGTQAGGGGGGGLRGEDGEITWGGNPPREQPRRDQSYGGRPQMDWKVPDAEGAAVPAGVYGASNRRLYTNRAMPPTTREEIMPPKNEPARVPGAASKQRDKPTHTRTRPNTGFCADTDTWRAHYDRAA